MVLQSTHWLALSYFTYFFSYGIYLPFWSVWLKGEGVSPETIGILLGAGLVMRFLGSLLIAPRVKDPTHLITALRLLALLSLAFAIGFCFGNGWAWLMLVIAGFNLFFSPLVPLTDALAATWQRQITLDYGRVRLWGSLAFVIGSALTGKLVSVWGHNAILFSLLVSILAMLLGMLLKPSVMPQGYISVQNDSNRSWRELLSEGAVWRFLLCVTLLQGAHAGYYSFASIYWQDAGYSAATIGYLWSLGVVAEVIIFASSNFLFRRWSARNLLLLSAVCGLLRWGLMASSTEMSMLLLAQVLHSGTFTVCHLAAMRFIAARQGAEVIRLQAVYSALAMGGGIAIMTVLGGFLFELLQGGVFWVMVAVVVPVFFVLPPAVADRRR
ncbi:3-phenylpropionate MFS transporter [Serratia sp. UGAL515B_01]|uniref:3-phenylpropionate MFS transporter n=1 Tax=Serratia sp. UGAL515B_01 TaxID=2986763 RepID=UPI0029532517|nr:3-phenylpropionate MFS transporter [Serratia sp. UGAL515B_01]WON75893.1 3-phenylpropionate MFS transporter [Serratia sp. UGAL515B_01]